MSRPFLFGLLFAAENGHHVLDRYHKQLIVGFEIDRNRILGMKQNLVVLPQRNVIIVFNSRRMVTMRPVMVGISAASGKAIPPLVSRLGSSLRTRTRGPIGSTYSKTCLSVLGILFFSPAKNHGGVSFRKIARCRLAGKSVAGSTPGSVFLVGFARLRRPADRPPKFWPRTATRKTASIRPKKCVAAYRIWGCQRPPICKNG